MKETFSRVYAYAVFIPTLLWNMLLGRWLKIRPWWSDVDDHVIIGALPLARDVEPLARLGVKGVVNTCLEYAGPQQGYATWGIEQLRVPTVDFTPPSMESIKKSIKFIKRHAEKGDKVYVHCKAGRARSATVVMCWLIQSHRMSPAEAQRLLLQKRAHVKPDVDQRQVVKDFFQETISGGDASSGFRKL